MHCLFWVWCTGLMDDLEGKFVSNLDVLWCPVVLPVLMQWPVAAGHPLPAEGWDDWDVFHSVQCMHEFCTHAFSLQIVRTHDSPCFTCTDWEFAGEHAKSSQKRKAKESTSEKGRRKNIDLTKIMSMTTNVVLSLGHASFVHACMHERMHHHPVYNSHDSALLV